MPPPRHIRTRFQTTAGRRPTGCELFPLAAGRSLPRTPALPGVQGTPGRRQSLEVELPSELHNSHLVTCGYFSETTRGQVGVWQEEAPVVEGVEHLEAEFKYLTFSEIPPLLDAHIPIK